MDMDLAGIALGDLNPLKKHLELEHLKWVKQIKESKLNTLHECIDALGNHYILRTMASSKPKAKMWQDLSKYRLPYISRINFSFNDGETCFVLEEKLLGLPLNQANCKLLGASNRDIIRMGIGIARDLGVLYRQDGILHLDIKPENILIDDYGNGRLIDFGAAVTAIDRTNMRNTQQMGTPRYMSPERYTDPNRIGPSADLYSLALTLKYAMAKWEITHFFLWQLLSKWSDPCELEKMAFINEEDWYSMFIQDLEEQLTT